MIEFPLNFFFYTFFVVWLCSKKRCHFPAEVSNRLFPTPQRAWSFDGNSFFTTFSDVNRFTCRVNTPELPLNKYISKLWYFLSLWYEMEKGSVYSRWTGSVVDCSRRFIDCVLLDHKVHLIIVMKTNMNE